LKEIKSAYNRHLHTHVSYSTIPLKRYGISQDHHQPKITQRKWEYTQCRVYTAINSEMMLLLGKWMEVETIKLKK
jgi:hypothetical protein